MGNKVTQPGLGSFRGLLGAFLIPLEQLVEEITREGFVVTDPLVKTEIRVHQVLQLINRCDLGQSPLNLFKN